MLIRKWTLSPGRQLKCPQQALRFFLSPSIFFAISAQRWSLEWGSLVSKSKTWGYPWVSIWPPPCSYFQISFWYYSSIFLFLGIWSYFAGVGTCKKVLPGGWVGRIDWLGWGLSQGDSWRSPEEGSTAAVSGGETKKERSTGRMEGREEILDEGKSHRWHHFSFMCLVSSE